MWLSVWVDMQWTRNSDTSQKTRQKIPKGTQAALSCANRPTPPLIFQWHQSTLQSSGLWSKPHVKSITVTDHKNSHNHQTLGTQETWIDWLSNCWVANWLLLAIYPLWYPGIESDWFEISFCFFCILHLHKFRHETNMHSIQKIKLDLATHWIFSSFSINVAWGGLLVFGINHAGIIVGLAGLGVGKGFM